MKFVDMFCGMGTIRMGFEQAGHECVYSVEWDKNKRVIYKVIFGKEPEANDITTVRGTDIPISDCWCFGAPCQDFSVAGLREGLEGDRSSLVKEVFRLVRETSEQYRPEWLFYENVAGMLSSGPDRRTREDEKKSKWNGFDFLEILFEMASLGYDIQYELLNSKGFGVPQNRERVYTLGHLRTRGERKVFPLGADCKSITKLQGQCANTVTARYYGAQAVGTYCIEREQLSEVKQIGNVMPTATRDNPNQGRVYSPTGLAPCLNKMEGGGREPLIASGIYTNVSPEYNRGPLLGLSRTLKADGNHPAGVMIQCVGNLNNGKSQRGRVYDASGLSPSLCSHSDTGAGLEPKALVGARIRRLTPRECMRLQGVPDYITDKLIAAGISDTQMYRAAGDACTVNVIYEIAKRL